MNFRQLIGLHETYNVDPFGIGSNLLSYLARPRILHSSFNFELAYDAFLRRLPIEQTQQHQFSFAPQDRNIFAARLSLICNDNRAFIIASIDGPTVSELEEFSYLKPCWSVLFAVKRYLAHHVELAYQYKGLVPFGKEVVKFMNSLDGFDIRTSSPDLRDHVNLKNLTNKYAGLLGMPSIVVNNIMHLEGQSLGEIMD